MSEIINKVAASGLITLDLESLYPEGERVIIDIADRLWQGLALREKEFREWIRSHDWEQYRDKYVGIHCSADAIIPMWSYMLIASSLEGKAKQIVYGNAEHLEKALFASVISAIDPEEYRDKRVVIKGCSNRPVPVSAYVEMMTKLQPVAKSIMFGEPCSTVPVYKKS